MAQVVQRRFHIVERDPFDFEPSSHGEGRLLVPIAEVRSGAGADREGLEGASRQKVSGRVRQKSIDQTVRPVFGEVDNGCRRIHRDRLMPKPAQGAKRDRIGEWRVPIGVHFKAIAMVLLMKKIRALYRVVSTDPEPVHEIRIYCDDELVVVEDILFQVEGMCDPFCFYWSIPTADIFHIVACDTPEEPICVGNSGFRFSRTCE